MLSLFREDLKKHDEGSPCYTDNSDEPMCFMVARAGTKLYREQIKEISDKLYGPFPNPSNVDDDEIIANWLAEYGVISWENLVDDETDEPEPYSKSFARMLFLNKSYWLSLNKVLITHAFNFENYLTDEENKDIDSLKKK